MAAFIALIPASTECGRPAAFDRVENLHLQPGERVSKTVDEWPARLADDISHLPGWPLHDAAVSGASMCLGPADTMIWSSGLTAACRWRRDR